jgi:hypothetical protein
MDSLQSKLNIRNYKKDINDDSGTTSCVSWSSDITSLSDGGVHPNRATKFTSAEGKYPFFYKMVNFSIK